MSGSQTTRIDLQRSVDEQAALNMISALGFLNAYFAEKKSIDEGTKVVINAAEIGIKQLKDNTDLLDIIPDPTLHEDETQIEPQ